MNRKRIVLVVGIIFVIVIVGLGIVLKQKAEDQKEIITKMEKTTTESELYTSEKGGLTFYEEGEPDEIESVNWDDIFEEDGSKKKKKEKHSEIKEQISKEQGAEKKENLQPFGETEGEKGKKANEEKNNNPSQKKEGSTKDSVKKQSDNSKEETTKKKPIGEDNNDDGYISLPDDY